MSLTAAKVNAQELFDKLVAATREQEADAIVKSLKGLVKWKPINGDYGNRRAISLLSKDSISALSERNYNSQDHVAIKELLLRGIDSQDRTKTPKSIVELGQKCFGLRGGSLGAELETRVDLSFHVMNFAQGSKDDVALSVLDDGEGIEPVQIEDTILSIGKSTKAGLPFTHGQWGHGGSGSYVFCGEKGYTFIATRKHPDLQPGCPIGFTLVREVPSDEMIADWNQAPYMEYMVDAEEKIFIIPAQEPKFPQSLKLPPSFHFGCWIKMFHYGLPSKGQINGVALKTKLDLLVMKPLLPVRVVECRSNDYNTDEANTALAYGILNRFSSPKDELKKTISIDTKMGLKERFGVQSIDIYLFQHKSKLTEIMKKKRRDSDDNVRTPANMHYIDKANAISFTVSGQLNFGISQVRLQSLTNFRSIYEYMLVHVDLTRMPPSIRSKVIPSSRQGRFETEAGRQLEQLILEELKANPELGLLDQEYEMLDAVGATRPEQLAKLAQKYSRIARVFQEGGIPLQRLKRRKRTVKEPFIGKDVPEFLSVQGTTQTLEVERGLPSDGSPSRVLLLTDAKNGYLTGGGGELLMNDTPGLIIIRHPLNDGRIPFAVRRDPGEPIPEQGVLWTIAMTRPGLNPLTVSLRYKLYDPQEGSKHMIEIQPGAALGTAPEPFIPKEFIVRVGHQVGWKNSDYEPHAFIIVDLEAEREITRSLRPIMPGQVGGWWKPEKEGMYQYFDTNNSDLTGLIHILPPKYEKENSVNPPMIIYLTQDGRTVDGHSTKSWVEDGEWSENKVVEVNNPGNIKSMKINLDYIGFVEYRDNMRPKNIPKLHVVIGREFVTLICAADQTLYKHYKDTDDVPEDYDEIIDSSARGIAEVLPTLMLDVREKEIENSE
jgi:hypothetical protein